jgi:hypothetical protein
LQTAGPTGLTKAVLRVANALLAQKPAMGALPQVRAAVAPDAQSGQYYGAPSMFETRGYPEPASMTSLAQDPKVAARLWEESETLTGVVYPL